MKIKYFLIGLGSLLVTGGVIWGVSKLFKNKEIEDKKNEEEEEKKKEQSSVNTASTSKWIDATKESDFPLKRWHKGDFVKELQTRLGMTGKAVDGYFGVDTENALYKKANVKECSLQLFKDLKTGKKIAWVDGINSTGKEPSCEKGTKIYASTDGSNLNLRSSASSNDGTFNNKIGSCANGGLIGEYNGHFEDVTLNGKKYRWIQMSITKDSKAEMNKGYVKGSASAWARGDMLKYQTTINI